MSMRITYKTDQTSGIITSVGGFRDAKKEVAILRRKYTGLSFTAIVNKKDVTSKIING